MTSSNNHEGEFKYSDPGYSRVKDAIAAQDPEAFIKACSETGYDPEEQDPHLAARFVGEEPQSETLKSTAPRRIVVSEDNVTRLAEEAIANRDVKLYEAIVMAGYEVPEMDPLAIETAKADMIMSNRRDTLAYLKAEKERTEIGVKKAKEYSSISYKTHRCVRRGILKDYFSCKGADLKGNDYAIAHRLEKRIETGTNRIAELKRDISCLEEEL